MAFKKTLAQRLLGITKISSQSHSNCRISYSSVQSRIPPSAGTSDIALDPGEFGTIRRFVHKKSVNLPELRPMPPSTGNLIRKLRDMDIARNRVRFDGLTPPESNDGVSVEEARKFLRAMQIENMKSKLRKIQQSCITYSEFIRICGENCEDEDQAMKVAKLLDDSAVIITVGDIVFLRPEQVAKSIQALLPVPEVMSNESGRKELEVMEKEKAAIDNKADTLVRRELWGGLGFMVLQTAALMRLTFWELSWDVMEPICFYLTSMYFMGGYTFFLRTSKEPSFEAFYQSRFSTKQKHQMKLHNFDISRYNQLRAASSFSQPLNKFHKNL
ncbi:hypothetical protein TanjilG_09401 [Lupinus angustifolius]|uniref:Calcium uniporter protein C-terminal domain-containing protein n=1 Tax=Lupinus angustifolius TaxID=3871 RepID=A0A4P1RFF8_LUPAN|nr:PREDICTED: calcium uniporter protein 2, mitochondrial-like [Lupinus angustifolius]XP_019446774.1 PREDICTED: calcium uniporter protein 2, mitochondrial-like [Lupinus angustifolius]OIW09728.1 hypothetical protein TanjilG_09401 [Lupinus angustifolius]